MRVLLIIVAALMAAPASADAMRCGNRVVREGDTRSAVRELCGEPADTQTTYILRRPSYWVGGRQYYFGDSMVEVPVETWTYNFGPYKLMRRVRIVDGLVESIETLGHGYREPASN